MTPENGRVLIGRNFDWDYGHGLMIVNKRGVAKHALGLRPTDTAKWISKYGSLTFNQAGRELPYGGMNEKGLMIEVLWLGWTAWPETSAPSMNEVQWIQYQLDMRASVADLVAHIDDVRILPAFAKVHFFVCDASSACAVIEGLGNKIAIHTGTSLPVTALTNDSYEASLKYASKFLPSACANLPADSMSSLARFTRAACAAGPVVERESPDAEHARVDAALNSVAQGDYTKWQITYDLSSRTIYLRTHDAPGVKAVSLDTFDLSCGKPVKIFDMNSAAAGDVSSQFVDYTREANRSIVEKSLLNGFAHLPGAVVDSVVAFPETLGCVQP